MKPKKPKKVNIQLIGSGHPLYQMLDDIIQQHHEHLVRARIGLCWHKGWRTDRDNHVTLGMARKANDLSRELSEYDFLILLSEEAWETLTEAQRLALLDHELCHCAADLDADDKQKEDERGRLCWRMRNHDIEEFREIVARHGTYKTDLEYFVKAALESKAAPLFPRMAAEA